MYIWHNQNFPNINRIELLNSELHNIQPKITFKLNVFNFVLLCPNWLLCLWCGLFSLSMVTINLMVFCLILQQTPAVLARNSSPCWDEGGRSVLTKGRTQLMADWCTPDPLPQVDGHCISADMTLEGTQVLQQTQYVIISVKKKNKYKHLPTLCYYFIYFSKRI